MAEHPSSYVLEELAAGSGNPETEKHVQTCEACQLYVARLQRAADKFAVEMPDAETFADQVAAKAKRAGKQGWLVAGAALPLVAAAAAVFLIMRPSDTTTGPVARATAPADTSHASVRFKGAPQLSVIREREGNQQRFSAEAGIRAHDRLRVEVSVDALTMVEVGVLSEDGQWVTLMPATGLSAGTHLTPEAVRFDDTPSAGWIIAGPPDAVLRARSTRVFDDVTVMRLHVERER